MYKLMTICKFFSGANQQNTYNKILAGLCKNKRMFKSIKIRRKLTLEERILFKETLFYIKLLRRFRYQCGKNFINKILNKY